MPTMRHDAFRRQTVFGVSAIALLATWAGAMAADRQPWSPTSHERTFEALGIRDGSTVCEIGAGDGAAAIAAARLVGEKGRVYASELGERRIKALQDAIAASALSTVIVVTGEETQTNLPREGCDAIFMRDVYHHLAKPAAINASLLAAAKPGARVAVVDFTPPNDEAPTPEERGKDGMHGVYPETVEREMKEAGFEVVSSDKGQRWFMVVVRRPDRGGTEKRGGLKTRGRARLRDTRTTRVAGGSGPS